MRPSIYFTVKCGQSSKLREKTFQCEHAHLNKEKKTLRATPCQEHSVAVYTAMADEFKQNRQVTESGEVSTQTHREEEEEEE